MLSRISWFNPELTQCSLNNASLFFFFFLQWVFLSRYVPSDCFEFCIAPKIKNRSLTQRFSWSHTTLLKALYPCLMSRWMQFKLALAGFVLLETVLVSGPRTLWVCHLLTHHWMQCTKEPFSDILFHLKIKDASENCLPLCSHLQNSNNQAETIGHRLCKATNSSSAIPPPIWNHCFSICILYIVSVCLGLGLG